MTKILQLNFIMVEYLLSNFMLYSNLYGSNYLGHVDIIEILLDYGSSVMAPDNYGSTPLHLACQKGHQRATVGSLHFVTIVVAKVLSCSCYY